MFRKQAVAFDADDDDEELDSEGEEAAEIRGKSVVETKDSDEEREKNETADQKRVRLAKQYLAKLGEDEDVSDEDADVGDRAEEDDDEEEDEEEEGDTRARIGVKLKRARLEATGGFRREVADSLRGRPIEPTTYRQEQK